MSKRMAILLTVLVALSLSAGLSAATRGTPAEAKAMLQKAVEHYKSAGRPGPLAFRRASRAPNLAGSPFGVRGAPREADGARRIVRCAPFEAHRPPRTWDTRLSGRAAHAEVLRAADLRS